MEALQQPTFSTPLAVPVPLRNGELVVKSAVMAQLLAAKALLTPVLRRLADQGADVFDGERLEAIAATKVLTARDVQDFCLLAEEADVAVDLVAALAPMPKAEVLQLPPDEFFYLLAVVAQVNVDFFFQALHVYQAAGQRVGPAWRAAQGGQATAGNG